MESMGSLRRSHHCNILNQSNIGEEVTLMGWVLRRRDHGGVIFIDLRDRRGITQVVFNPEVNPEVHAKAHGLRSEWVLAVRGKVGPARGTWPTPSWPPARSRSWSTAADSQPEPDPALPLDEEVEVSDSLRLKYRYLDLRRPAMAANWSCATRPVQAIRSYLNDEDFLEIETPVLTRSTPEGARDYLVPSRVNPGRFYALPQSPQLFKQLLMVAGMDRYYQIVKCFRDEDLRADRQPEFTQIDLELSFVDEEEVMGVNEGMMKPVQGHPGPGAGPPFPRMTYAEAMNVSAPTAPTPASAWNWWT
jgi:aspartyl-tRNA synthetase